MKTTINKLSSKLNRKTGHRICAKTNRKLRHESKSETRYRSLENTMLGEFRYSI